MSLLLLLLPLLRHCYEVAIVTFRGAAMDSKKNDDCDRGVPGNNETGNTNVNKNVKHYCTV